MKVEPLMPETNSIGSYQPLADRLSSNGSIIIVHVSIVLSEEDLYGLPWGRRVGPEWRKPMQRQLGERSSASGANQMIDFSDTCNSLEKLLKHATNWWICFIASDTHSPMKRLNEVESRGVSDSGRVSEGLAPTTPKRRARAYHGEGTLDRTSPWKF